MVEKQLFPRRELSLAGEVDEKGTSRIKPKDVSVIVWDEQSMKAAMESCIATVKASPVNLTELMFLPLM